MPTVILTTVAGFTRKEKESLVAFMTDATERITKRDKRVIRVIIEEIPEENYALAGVTFKNRRESKDGNFALNDTLVEIRVKAGRTPEEINTVSDQFLEAFKENPAFAGSNIRVILTELAEEKLKMFNHSELN